MVMTNDTTTCKTQAARESFRKSENSLTTLVPDTNELLLPFTHQRPSKSVSPCQVAAPPSDSEPPICRLKTLMVSLTLKRNNENKARLVDTCLHFDSIVPESHNLILNLECAVALCAVWVACFSQARPTLAARCVLLKALPISCYVPQWHRLSLE